MSDTIRFAVIYQYISKMFSRWGPVSRELAAIKAHLRTQSVVFARSPLLDGSEVNLPRLYHAVERNGGLSNVIQRMRWGRVADEMKLTKLQHPERKLDPIYMRYLLPYATLSDQERQSIMAEVEKCWTTKYQKMLERARNPFQRQNRMLGTECESESDDEGEDGNTAGALQEAEDCIVQGRTMNLVTFKKIATSLMDAHFDPSKQPPGAVDVEKAYWRAVLLGTEHIVANTASIDTGEEGYGFPKDPQADYGAHPWNLKIPTSWRGSFLGGGTLELFFELQQSLSGGGLAGLALACLVQLASVRRSLFGNNERAKFLNRLAHGVLTILENTQVLTQK
ncbi:protein Jumonji-like [Cydia pomonella]|uniref:protein Jumonji-like n=1 Tax=Cydia pomonella TaxID=82600 RepID=UPI002ADD7CE6|nr:protein Jumonji-like [Cydia pomonella]